MVPFVLFTWTLFQNPLCVLQAALSGCLHYETRGQILITKLNNSLLVVLVMAVPYFIRMTQGGFKMAARGSDVAELSVGTRGLTCYLEM